MSKYFSFTISVTDQVVFVRADMNVPIRQGIVEDDTRLKAALPLLSHLVAGGAKVVLGVHVGKDGTESVAPVVAWLRSAGLSVQLLGDWHEYTTVVTKLKSGTVLCLPNLRSHSGEESNNSTWAAELADACDLYINEGFSVSHRAHASVHALPQVMQEQNKSVYLGPHFKNEVEYLSRTFTAPHPMVVILGGAKVETKLPLIKKFITKAETIYVLGAVAHDVMQEKGLEVGKSLVSPIDFNITDLTNANNVFLPLDVVVETAEGESVVRKIAEVKPGDTIYDAGPETLKQLRASLESAAFVLWNGPLGLFEKGYDHGTKQVAEMIAAHPHLESIAGGGDTVAAINDIGRHSSFTFISTGGGAMLDFLADGMLPGIEVIKDKQ